MEKLAQLKSLKAITDAKYLAEQAAFQSILAEEASLRAELIRLKEMLQVSRTTSLAPSEMRAIGADILWQGWIGRSRGVVNIKLARILAIKESRMQSVRKAYGKVLVVEELIAKTTTAQHRLASRGQLDAAINQALFR